MQKMRFSHEDPPADDTLPLPDEDEEEETPLSPSELAKAQAYDFDGHVFYLADSGFMYNSEGYMVTTGRRRQVLDEGQTIKKVA